MGGQTDGRADGWVGGWVDGRWRTVGYIVGLVACLKYGRDEGR